MAGHWEVPLQGRAEDLQLLAGTEALGPAPVVCCEGRFSLVFEQRGEDNIEVLAKAERLAQSLNGLLRLRFKINASISTANTIIPVSPSGDRGVVAVLTPARLELKPILLSVETNGTVSSPAESVQPDLLAASEDPSIEKALRLWGKGKLSWDDLYRGFEVIKLGCGGKIPSDWASNDHIKNFRHTANSVGAIGDESRHGVESTQPPDDPMSKPAAEALIECLLKAWLALKRTEGPTSSSELAGK